MSLGGLRGLWHIACVRNNHRSSETGEMYSDDLQMNTILSSKYQHDLNYLKTLIKKLINTKYNFLMSQNPLSAIFVH